jgi:tRNA modification GTPase
MVLDTDTIAALATPPGRGGVGIIRISGPATLAIAERITAQKLQPRFAHYGSFFQSLTNSERQVIDNGIAIYFKKPHSFTGEDVLELQAHGGPVILDCLLREVLKQGARLARPGEFSERAFLNNKIDLVQAEAIADLIDSASEQAAKNSLRTLQGEFSKKIKALVESIIALRIYVEASIDFPEEEIDFLADGKVASDLDNIITELQQVFEQARQGSIIREGMNVVIAGKPNAGKSSLLNALSGKESAIVTDIEGTTRDVLREHIQIDGMPLHIIDTAGLRESPDVIEQEGIRRAWSEIENADRILFVVDSQKSLETDPGKLWPEFSQKLSTYQNVTVIHNKIDLAGLEPCCINGDPTVIRLAAKHKEGIELLKSHLKATMGYTGAGEGGFTARRRHIVALEQAMAVLATGKLQLENDGAGELLAEDLRQAQNFLNEITGEFTPDDLLGKIFSSFCIGK